MGEIPSDIRAILEALARKDISIEEAEQLILSIKQKESYHSPKEKKYENLFWERNSCYIREKNTQGTWKQ